MSKLQSILALLENGLGAKMNLLSTGLHRNPEIGTSRFAQENRFNMDFSQSNSAGYRKGNSVDSQNKANGFDRW